MKRTPFPRLLASVTAAALAVQLLTVLPVSVFAADDEITGTTSDGFDYKIKDGIVSVTGYSGEDRDTVTALRLPEKISGTAVTVIGSDAFGYMSALSTVSIPDTVTRIDPGAFHNTALTSLDLPADLTYIGREFIAGVETLKELTLPKGLPEDSIETASFIGGWGSTFKDSYVEKLILEDGMEIVPNDLCYGAPHIRTVIIPDSVTEIGRRAFGSASVTELELPDTITVIHSSAFAGSGLTSLKLPDTVTTLGSEILADCMGVTELTIPASVTSAQFALQNSGVEELTAADGMETLPSYIAAKAKKLKKVTLPSSLTKLGGSCFWESGITEFTVPKQLTEASGDFDHSALETVSFEEGLTRVPDKLLQYANALKTINWNSTVTEIGENAFASCSALEEAAIPDTVTEIGYAAFQQCAALKTLHIPDCGAKIGSYAFAGCTALEYAYLPMMAQPEDESGAYYKDYEYGFFQKSGLKTIEFAPEITVIPGGVCEYCGSLETIIWPSAPVKIDRYAFNDCKSLAAVTIPDTVTAINEFAFDGCEGITELHLPAELNHLGRETFRDTVLLKELFLPHELTDDNGYYPFRGCGAEKVVIADGITKIAMTFAEMPNLRTVVFPDSLTEIGENAFVDCTALTDVILPPALTTIGNYAFNGCSSLDRITIPKTLTSTGWASRFSSTLSHPSGLTEVWFENGMETIPKGILYDAENLRTVHIPSSVTEIGESAFSRCINLETLDMRQDEIKFAHDSFESCDSLFDERVDLYKKSSTYTARVVSRTSENGLINYTVYYELNPRFADKTTAMALSISTANSNRIDNASLPAGLNPGEGMTTRLNVDLFEKTGVFRFSTRPDENADTNVDILFKITMQDSYGWYTKRIPVDGNAAPRLSLLAPSAVNVKDGQAAIKVFGFSQPDDEITILVNGEPAAAVTANPYNGKYVTELTVSAAEGDVLTLTAQCGDAKSDPAAVICRTGQNEVRKVILTIHGHAETKQDITDVFTEGRVPCFAYNPSYPLQFEVTLENNDCAAVFVASTVNDGMSAIELHFDETTGTWIGEGRFDPIVPGKLSILAIQDKCDPVLRTARDDGGYTYTVNGHDVSIDAPVQEGEWDWAREFLKEAKQEVIAQSDSSLMVGYTFEAKGEKGALLSFNGTADSIVLDGEQLTSAEVAKDPAKYGFEESGARVVDENGKVHVYYTRVISDEETINANAEQISISIPEGAPKPSGQRILSKTARLLAMGFEGAASAIGVATDVHSAGGVFTLDRVLGEEDADHGFFLSWFNELGSSKLGDWITEGAKKIGLGVKNLGDKIGNAMTWLDMGKEVHTYYNQLEEITNSDAPYVVKHRDAVYTMSTALCVAKVVTIGGTAIATGAVILACGLTAPAALTVGVVIGVGWLIGKGWDILGNRLKMIIKGEAELNCVGEFKVLLDPSGIAYEYLPSNPVEGARAEVYYQDSSGSAVLWDAEHYDQVNPQITDTAGWFAWDVPEGFWQVRLSKEGYTDAQSGWLPVLPVQVGIDLNMTSSFPAQIKETVSKDGKVTVRFDRHVLDSSISADSLYLTDQAGKKLTCTPVPEKEEGNETDASIVFVFDAGSSAEENGLIVHLTSGAKSYAGIASAPQTCGVFVKAVPGDISGDGECGLVDAVILARYLNESGGVSPEHLERIANTDAADLNADGSVDLLDFKALLSKLAGNRI